jgi:protein gp37
MPTAIQWTEETWNPVSGCRRKSPGCLNCYAERVAHRLSGNPNEKIHALYSGVTQITNGRPGWTGTTGFSHSALLKPILTRKPTTYFISLSDLFFDKRPYEDIFAVLCMIAKCQRHRFQILTKYIDRAQEILSERRWRNLGEIYAPLIPGEHRADDAEFLPNLWLGVSCEDQQRFVERTSLLRRTPAAVRFLSLEPLLADLGEIDLAGIDWVIAGSESGPGARPAQVEWFRAIKDQCVAADVPYFLKQFADSNGHKIGTPELDGQQWMQMPEVKR